jgi:hypothetical protein
MMGKLTMRSSNCWQSVEEQERGRGRKEREIDEESREALLTLRLKTEGREAPMTVDASR